MNARIPARRLAQPAVSLPLTPHRTFISDLFNRFRKRDKNEKRTASPEKPKVKNPLLENYLKNKPEPISQQRPEMKRGTLTKGSIFEDQAATPTPSRREDTTTTPTAAVPAPDEADRHPGRDRNAMAAALHPDPRGDARWARKMVIRETQRRGRVSRAVQLRRQEREDLVKSPLIKTSVKKLVKLAHQIQGKPIEEAILQMRFSKKKAATEVLKHLEYARDHATVARGMGLGEAQQQEEEGGGAEQKPVEIELKDGSRKVVKDKTGIYVDQAWVGRGPYGKAYEFRARGRMNILRTPTTSISVVLKEEATRIRQSEDIKKKRDNRKLWTQLPDRPIQQQRQHVLW